MNTNLMNSQYFTAAHAERTAALTAAWRRPSIATPKRPNPIAALLRRPVAVR